MKNSLRKFLNVVYILRLFASRQHAIVNVYNYLALVISYVSNMDLGVRKIYLEGFVVELRPCSTDVVVFTSIFSEELECLREQRDIKLIFDLGAYTGLSALWLHLCFPNAKIIAVEADARNYELCKRNTERLPNVVLENLAVVGGDEKSVSFGSRDTGDWGSSIYSDQPHLGNQSEVRALSFDLLVEKYGCPDVVKMDIEGAEIDIIKKSKELHHIPLMVIEFHERFTNVSDYEMLRTFDKHIITELNYEKYLIRRN